MTAGTTSPNHTRTQRLIELLFFAYRDFVSDPDDILAEYGFGRAHHRVLHFVARVPGLKVADLLDILNITKQSLSRVLRELIDQGYIHQEQGRDDRRQRLLYVTKQGEELMERLVAVQVARIERALDDAGLDNPQKVMDFLLCMTDDNERQTILDIVEGNEPEGYSELRRSGQ